MVPALAEGPAAIETVTSIRNNARRHTIKTPLLIKVQNLLYSRLPMIADVNILGVEAIP